MPRDDGGDMTNQKCIGCDTPIPPGSNSCPMCGATVKSHHASTSETHSEPSVTKPPPVATPVKPDIISSLAGKIKDGFKILFVFVICMAIIRCAILNSEKQPATPTLTPQQIAANKEKDEHDEAQYHAKSFIEKSLKAPATAKFPSYNEFLADKKGGYWEVYTYVDAQNSFGAMIRTRFCVKMKNLGDTWQLVDIQTY